ITIDASFRALDAFISPSAAMTLILTFALASRAASASAAIALCSCCGSLTSLISTRSTLIPHESVASSRVICSREENYKTNFQLESYLQLSH
uniref:Uncharacterized protein n=1 Tax=Sinocyclocheilus rhinocerous TaxID=307959 RepID=A0A673HEW9_9TELE